MPPAGDLVSGSGVPQQRQPSVGDNKPPPPPDALVAPAFRALYLNTVQRTKDRLAALHNTAAGSDTELAIAIAADMTSALQLERASRSIFQSQLEALEQLQWGKVGKDSYRKFYDQAAQAHPDVYASYSFDSWFGFLLAVGLVEGPDDAIVVTPLGRAIKMYMAQQRYNPTAA